MRITVLCLFTGSLMVAGCNACWRNSSTPPEYGDIPGPPINTIQVTEDLDAASAWRSRGIVDIKLNPDNPKRTFWNDRENQKDEWGTITLVGVQDCCTATIRFGEHELSTRPGSVFPRKGLFLVNADPEAGSIWIRSRWTHTVMQRRSDESAE